MKHFYPRPPRGGRPTKTTGDLSLQAFLSTPSARRATRAQQDVLADLLEFLSTPSARRATARPVLRYPSMLHFYPRPPRGGRRGAVIVRR